MKRKCLEFLKLRNSYSDGVERVVAFSQYPQYSCVTSGSSFNAIASHYNEPTRSGLSSIDCIPPPRYQAGGLPIRPSAVWSFLDRWPTSMPEFVDVVVENIRHELSRMPSPFDKNGTVILFSAHSIPMSIINRGDPYIQVSEFSPLLREYD